MRTAVSILLCLWLLLAFNQVCAAQPQTAAPLEKVKLQLKWFHQFQFAGYYAAKQQGYYAQEGLDVEIFERRMDKDGVQQVVSGEMDFAVGDSGIVSYFARGEPIVALAAIFQHDPLVFISKQNSGIISPYEMRGKKIMFDSVGAGDAPLRAILADANLTENSYTAVKHTFNSDDLITGKVAVISGYMSDQPFYFKEKNFKINIINPQSYGIDFYGDILFTSQHELAQHPGRAEKLRRASLKGWQYALEHPAQLIQLIQQTYHSKLSLAHLQFEAEITRKLILPDTIPLGQIEPRRLQKVAEVYAQLKISKALSENELANFIYTNNSLNLTDQERSWLKAHPQIRLGIDRDFAPYEWLDTKGNYVGLAADYIALFEQKLGVKFTIRKDKTWTETLAMAKRGELDMIACAVTTPERQKFLSFTQAFITTPIIIINDGHFGFIGTLNRLNGKQVAIEQGYFMQELLSRDYPKIHLVLANSVNDALNKVAEGKADAYVGDAASATHAIQESGLLSLKFSGQTDYVSSHSVAVSKANPELLSILTKVLNSISASEQAEIKNHWLSLPVHEGISRASLIKYSIVALLIFLIFLGWNLHLRREIAKRKMIEQHLRTLSVAIEQSPASVVITDLAANLLYVNPKFSQITGYAFDEVIGKNPRILHSGLTPEQHYVELWGNLTEGEAWHGELINQRKNGEIYWEDAHIAPVKNAAGLTTHYVGVKTDITERKRIETELQQTKEIAIAANQAKSEFLANMSHEIRTPMNAILGFTSILANLISDPLQHHYLEAIDRSGKTLLQLINDILDLSKIEAGKFELALSPIAIKSIFDDISIIFTQKITEKNLNFSLEIAPNIPAYLVLDEIRLRQILLNIIGNAVKFTDRGFIKVSVTRQPPLSKQYVNLLISVTDSGMGIAPDQLATIFDAFIQQKKQSVRYGGTGLGLTICKRLIAMMEGRITVNSVLGRGSCFTIELPLVEICHHKETVAVLNNKPQVRNVHFQPASVLLVDDVETNRELIKAYLIDYPELTLTGAETAAQAFTLLQQQQFDLIFMDKILPDDDGDSVCMKIKALPQYAQTPIIMITATAMLPYSQQPHSFYNLQLNKPVTKPKLLAAMQTFLPLIDKAKKPAQQPSSAINSNALIAQNLPELMQVMQASYQKTILQLHRSGVLQIDELVDIAEQLLPLAQQHECELLADWAARLKHQAELFDLESIPATLKEFESVLAQLSQALARL